MSEVRILAIENDPLCAEALKVAVEQLGYSLMTMVNNMADAMRAIRRDEPDVILMGIDIDNKLTGTNFVQIIQRIRYIPVIFITAFKNKSVSTKVNDMSSAGFGITPREHVSLQAAVQLARVTKSKADSTRESRPLDSFFIANSHRLIKINVAEIVAIEVEEKYCYIVTQQRRYIINIRLKQLLKQLPPEDFIQIHRSYVVRKSAIEEINNTSNKITLAGKMLLPVGKTYRETLLSSLNYLIKT